MTPGQEALLEAARLEQARIYGTVQREHKQPQTRQAVAEIDAAWGDYDPLPAGIADGLTNAELMHLYGATYAEVRQARKQAMKEAV